MSAWPGHTMAMDGIVSGTVDRADDPAAFMVEEVSRLPIHFDRYMGAPIHVRDDAPVEAQSEGPGLLAPQLDIETEGQPALGQRR